MTQGPRNRPSPVGIVAVGNLKGGVGKSTLAVNLACWFGMKGASARRHPVVLVDADAQGTALEWAASGLLPVDLIEAPLDEHTDHGAWHRLVSDARDQAGLVVIDLPPHWGPALTLALAIADLLVMPVTPSGADLRATQQALERLRSSREQRDGAPAAMLIPSKIDRRTAAGREIADVLAELGEPVGPSVAQRSAHVDAFTTGRWIGDWAPRSTAAAEIGALARHVREVLR